MAKNIPEVKIILEKLCTAKQVAALYELSKKKEVNEPIFELLSILVNREKDTILRMAGGINSLDTMINNSVEQSFRRGRISLAVLFHALVINAEKEMERRERRK